MNLVDIRTNHRRISSRLETFWLFMFALILRLSYVMFVYITDVSKHFTDDVFYRKMAIDLVRHGRIVYDLEALDVRYDWLGPVLPWINGFTLLLFGECWIGFFVVTSLASSLITVYIYKLTSLIASRKAALFAGLWSSVYFYFIMFSAGAGKDIWMILAFIASSYYLLRSTYSTTTNSTSQMKEKVTTQQYLYLGIFTIVHVLSMHLDERFAALSPLFFFFILLEGGLKGVGTRVKPFMFSVILCILLLMPWQIRNYFRYGKVVVLTRRTEHITDKLLGYNQEHYELDTVMDFYQTLVIHPSQTDSVITGHKTHTDGGFEIPKSQIQAMRRGILPHSYSLWEGMFSRAKILLQPWQFQGEYTVNGYYYYERSLKNNLVSICLWGFVSVLGLIGLFILRNKQRTLFLFVGMISIYLALHILAVPYTVWRYRLPIDTLMLVSASIAVDKLIAPRREKSEID